MRKNRLLSIFCTIALVCGVTFVSADEGMWLLNNLPLKLFQEKYNFVPTDDWVSRVQLSSARLPNCSSSFVSDQGLLMTNWHCSEEAVKALSTSANNYYENGFYASTFAQELKTNLNVRVLVSMEDVTSSVLGKNSSGIPRGMPNQTIAEIEKNSYERTGLLCEVVTLYQGGRYHNYCYKVYDDIRLVFMPEQNVGFFGGDGDNFEYPRYTLDASFLRAYENGEPAKTPNHFSWSRSGASEKELIFVSGHPGRTERLLTSEALKTQRDVTVPFLLDLFRRRELTTQQFMIRSEENRRVAESDLFSWQNSRKLYVGKLRGLQDRILLMDKRSSEIVTFTDSFDDPALRKQYEDGLTLIAQAQEDIRDIYPQLLFLVGGYAFDSRLYQYAASLVSGDVNYAKGVFEDRAGSAPLNLEYEHAKLLDSMTHFVEATGFDSDLVRDLFVISPRFMADLLVYRSKLSDVNFHKQALDSGIGQSNDAMIDFAKTVASKTGDLRKKWADATEKEKQGYAKISGVLFRLYGTSVYPDATFTLRLSFGTVSGYMENGKQMPVSTTISGAYIHAEEFGNQGDHQLPQKWLLRKNSVRLNTPLNFVSDLDITGGNSGSPVFNKNLEIVGLVFDSNIHGLTSDYDYKYSPQARAIAVHSAGILELLSKVYRADRLVRELTKK